MQKVTGFASVWTACVRVASGFCQGAIFIAAATPPAIASPYLTAGIDAWKDGGAPQVGVGYDGGWWMAEGGRIDGRYQRTPYAGAMLRWRLDDFALYGGGMWHEPGRVVGSAGSFVVGAEMCQGRLCFGVRHLSNGNKFGSGAPEPNAGWTVVNLRLRAVAAGGRWTIAPHHARP